MFNLIDERWIPVECLSGNVRMIAPWEISDREDPPVHVAFSRPDMNSAIVQFLIGLVQTAAAPVDVYEWMDLLEEPLPPAELRRKFEAVRGAFELFSDAAPFMQQVDIEPDKSISMLLATSPGENTLKLNKDFFIKRCMEKVCLCPSCAAAALYTFQTIGPMGGRGQRGSMRGMCPMTVVMECGDLYSTVMLNVISLNYFGNEDESKITFTWVNGPCPEDMPISHANPSAIYWTTVKRLRLGQISEGVCMLCGHIGDVVASCGQKPRGTQYVNWKYPLCPYVIKDGKIKHMQASSAIAHLNQWMPLLFEGFSDVEPATNVKQAMANAEELRDIRAVSDAKVWISGYVNKQALPEEWVDVHEPSPIQYSKSELVNVKSSVRAILRLSDYGDNRLYAAVKKLSDSREPGKSRKTVTIPSSIIDEYWNTLDMQFLSIQKRLNNPEEVAHIWADMVRETVNSAFDRCVETIDFDHYRNVISAKDKLRSDFSDKAIAKVLNKNE